MRSARRALDAAGRVADDRVRRFPDEVDLALADGVPRDPDRGARERALLPRQPGALDGRSDLLGDRAGHARLRAARSAARVGGGAHARDPGVSGRRAPGASRLAARLASRGLRECSAAVRLFGTGLPHWWSDLHRTHTIGRALFDDLQSSARAAGRGVRRVRAMARADLLDGGSGRTTRARTSLACCFAAATGARRRSTLCWPKHATRCRRSRPSSSDGRARSRRAAGRRFRSSWPPTIPPLTTTSLPSSASWHACREMAIARDLVTWPDAPIRYVPIPDAHA